MNSFLELLDRQFGGSTVLGVVDGRWVAEDGVTVAEKMLRVEVTIKNSQVRALEAIAKQIGKKTKQQVMYVVINYHAETRFLFIEDDRDDEQGTPVAKGG
jgi:hypothetical protein